MEVAATVVLQYRVFNLSASLLVALLSLYNVNLLVLLCEKNYEAIRFYTYMIVSNIFIVGVSDDGSKRLCF